MGEKLFRTREIPRSGSKAKDGEKRRLNDGKNNGQAMHGARKPPGPKSSLQSKVLTDKVSVRKIRYISVRR